MSMLAPLRTDSQPTVAAGADRAGAARRVDAEPASLWRQLDIGCGAEKPPGFIGLDRVPFDGVDVVFDLDSKDKWPFEDDTFSFIRAVHVIEHVRDTVQFLSELHRVGRAGCVIELTTPHFSSRNSWLDPTHVHHFSAEFLDLMADGYLAYPQPKFQVIFRALRFGGLFHTWPGWLISKLSVRKYETYYAWRYPANSVTVRARIIK